MKGIVDLLESERYCGFRCCLSNVKEESLYSQCEVSTGKQLNIDNQRIKNMLFEDSAAKG